MLAGSRELEEGGSEVLTLKAKWLGLSSEEQVWPNTHVYTGDADETDPPGYHVKMLGSYSPVRDFKMQNNSLTAHVRVLSRQMIMMQRTDA